MVNNRGFKTYRIQYYVSDDDLPRFSGGGIAGKATADCLGVLAVCKRLPGLLSLPHGGDSPFVQCSRIQGSIHRHIGCICFLVLHVVSLSMLLPTVFLFCFAFSCSAYRAASCVSAHSTIW